MAFCRLVLLFLVICIASTYGKVPVYLWGDLETSIKSNPLSSITETEFEDILKTELQMDTFTVIFVEQTLSAEDFSRKNSEGESSFPYLQRTSALRQAVYLPGVENAVAALTDVVDPEKVDRLIVNNKGITDQIVPQNGRILFVNFEDAAEDENRADMLQRHDEIMRDIIDNIKDGYIAVYTGLNPSWTVPESHSRIRRQAERSHIQNVTLNGLKMYVNRVVVTVDGTVTNVTEVDTTNSEINGTEMSTTMTSGDNSLTLNFMKKAGYWFFSSVIHKQGDHETVLMPETEVFAQDGFAYRCGQNVTFSNRINQTVIVNFQDLKVQPYFRENSSDTLMYGDSINCVGFFTVPIWSGLFVTFILLAITFYGIMMMMDIRTMDRFDDPKGKTISINAE